MMKTLPVAALVLALTLLPGCQPHSQPQPGVAPGENAPSNAARATLDGITLEARLIETRTLGADMAKRYGIAPGEDRWMLLITPRDAAGNGVPADTVQIDARSGDLTEAPKPITLRTIRVDGFNDVIGEVRAKAPATLRIEIDARRGSARAEMRFSRELPAP